MSHPTEDLAAYVAGALPPAGALAVEEHLAACAACRDDAAAWRRLATTVRDASVRVPGPPPALLAQIRRRLTPAAPRYLAGIAAHPFRRAAAVLGYQWRLIRWPVWVTSGVVLAAGALVAGLSPGAVDQVLAMVVPLVAALAIAGACGTDADPAEELTRATMTSPRVVLLARLTVVLASATGAGMLATLLLALPGRAGSGLDLMVAWLGPLVPLCALSFALSVLWRPAAGVGVAVALWLLRALSTGYVADGWLASLVYPLWTLHAPVLVAAAALVAVTVFLAPLRPLRHG